MIATIKIASSAIEVIFYLDPEANAFIFVYDVTNLKSF
jgi:hypothetical protein